MEYEKTNNDILGYGRIITILKGSDSEGNPIYENYHITPVGIKDIRKAELLINDFFDAQNKASEENISTEGYEKATSEMYSIGAEIVLMSTKKMHKNLSKEYIMEHFTLSSYAVVIDISLDLNDFLSRMRDMHMKRMKMITN